ncbi:hypothetical protein QUC32_17255 [Novosphingobium resinovorum]|uniref:Secreted protein n=1 Tax=Novosphingobium resinovorum TaxID=158500 RepID=A0A1D8A1Q0_9SPHN|nr:MULTISPECIES: hypothetical protein [Novosphingobium]AOR76034.1 hypothetical protein BES08_04135 [Novosphingobium resinovorum]MBF7011414.1 hypothetical protein [Novosphingobium sp. HR1a]WJM29393.1 hypothetical protein QUC32_17255 [Novosphingobium resinovorum]
MIRILAFALALTASMPSLAQEASGNRLELACMGGGAANKVDQATVNAWDNHGNSAGANVLGTRSVGFEDQVNLWIEGAEGRVRMPRSMLPPIRGGENGWFKLKDIEISDREITASVAVNALNNPKLRVDRYSGMISISGKAGDFTGRCQKYDPATERRAF